MRTFSTVVVVAPLFAAVSLFSACVGSDTPVAAAKIDSSVPPVNDGGAADGGADGPAVEVDAGPKRCATDADFQTNAILLDFPTPTGQEIRGGRPVPNMGTVFALVGGLKDSRLFVLPAGGSANNVIPIETPTTGAVLSSADIRVEGAADVRIVFSEGNMPIHPENYGDRAMKTGKLTLTNGSYKISEVTVLGGPEIDQAEAQLLPEGILMSYRAFDGNGGARRKLRLLEGALSLTGITARNDVFSGPASETSPYQVANGTLYFATLDESQLVTGIRARRPDATIATVPIPLPQAAWKGGVTWVSPDECEVWYNAPKSPSEPRSILWRATRKPK